ncbi:cytochrome b [Methylomonas sp. MgM2]
MTKKANNRFSSLTIVVHWLMFLLIVALYASIELRSLFPKGSDPRELMKAVHFMLGLTVFLLLVPRLAARFAGTRPAITPEPPAWQYSATKFTHLALYLFMFAMPLLGWLMLSAAGKPIPFFGLQLPALIDKNKEIAKLFKELHETIGELGYYLIGLHISAALYHHYWQRDNTVIRMFPPIKPIAEASERT